MKNIAATNSRDPQPAEDPCIDSVGVSLASFIGTRSPKPAFAAVISASPRVRRLNSFDPLIFPLQGAALEFLMTFHRASDDTTLG